MPVITEVPVKETKALAALVTAVTIAGLPEGAPPFLYRCHLRSRASDGSLLLEQVTQGRTHPDWLVKYLHSGLGALDVTVQFRPAPDADWRDLGAVTAQPVDALGGERGALVELPITACRFAPDMKVNLQLSKADAAPTEETIRPVRSAIFSRTAKCPVASEVIDTA